MNGAGGITTATEYISVASRAPGEEGRPHYVLVVRAGPHVLVLFDRPGGLTVKFPTAPEVMEIAHEIQGDLNVLLGPSLPTLHAVELGDSPRGPGWMVGMVLSPDRTLLLSELDEDEMTAAPRLFGTCDEALAHMGDVADLMARRPINWGGATSSSRTGSP